MRKLASWMWVSIAVLAAADAAAQGCGAVLTSSVVLTADVVCGPGQDGLTVAASNVAIDLNGFSVIGSSSTVVSNRGIRASGVDAVTIRGPGHIKGFDLPIAIEGGVAHTIHGVTAISPFGSPVLLRNASLSLIEASRITHLTVLADPGFNASENRIVRNRLGAPYSGPAILLEGCGTSSNLVYENRIDHTPIALSGAHSNWIQGNRVNSYILLSGASANTIVNNQINTPASAYAIRITDGNPAFCTSIISFENRIIANEIHGGFWSVWMDGQANRNQISENTFSNPAIGQALQFDGATFDNDARFNRYVNVSLIAVDYGTGNLWP